jgi:predicted Zn-dependent peptidase
MHNKDFDPYDFEKKEINDVPVYSKNLPWAPCVHIRIAFNVGAFNDEIGKEGTAHFLEHMLFQGCPSMPNEKAIREFEKIYTLDSLNASTGHYRTLVIAKTLPEHIEKVLTVIKDMIFNSYIRVQDVEHERAVITQEAWRRYKNEKYLNYVREVDKIIFPKHQHSRVSSALGWPETITAITQKDIYDFYKKNYIKENMFIVLVGAVEKETIDAMTHFLDNIPSGDRVVINPGETSKPLIPKSVKIGEEIGDPTEQVDFTIVRVDKALGEKDYEINGQSIDLLQDLLFERLRTEHNLCYGVSVGWNQQKDYREIFISLKTSEDKMELAEKEIWNVIHEIIDGKKGSMFDLIHNLYIEQLKSKERLSRDIAENIVYRTLVYGNTSTLNEMIASAEKVTYDDVIALVKKTFDPEYVFTEVILPSKKT